MAGADHQHQRACLLGGAVGGSSGAGIEFWSLDHIRERFADGLTELPPQDGFRGAITGDRLMRSLDEWLVIWIPALIPFLRRDPAVEKIKRV